jgi:hypothetical protein
MGRPVSGVQIPPSPPNGGWMEVISLIISVAALIIVPIVLFLLNHNNNKRIENYKLIEDSRYKLTKDFFEMYNSIFSSDKENKWNVENRLINTQLLILLFDDDIIHSYHKFWSEAKGNMSYVSLEPLFVDILLKLRKQYFKKTKVTKNEIIDLLITDN